MRILIAPQEFKGSLTATEAARFIADGLRRALPDAELDLAPLADGGPGTVEALVEATNGRYVETEVRDPLGRPVRARWGVLGGASGGTAVIEMAAASGLTLLLVAERDPLTASTYGTGELIRAALDAGCSRLIVGAGGSATNDGGAGMAQALGARLLDDAGDDLPPGGAALARLERVDVTGLDPRLQDAEVTVASDVTNALCGPEGASFVYGPQKGAAHGDVRLLDTALANYARVIARDLGPDVASIPGSGAAGGLAAGLIAFCGARVRPGFDVVARAVGLQERIRRADVVVTGEGRLDRQTAFGKTPAGVARLSRRLGRAVVAVVGEVIGKEAEEPPPLFDALFALSPELANADDAIAQAPRLLQRAAREQLAPWIQSRAAS